MDLTLQSYLNEAVFSAGRGPEATFVSYLQTDHGTGNKNENAEDSSTSSQDRDPHPGLLQPGKGSFISYIDDDDEESDSDDVSVWSVLNETTIEGFLPSRCIGNPAKERLL